MCSMFMYLYQCFHSLFYYHCQQLLLFCIYPIHYTCAVECTMYTIFPYSSCMEYGECRSFSTKYFHSIAYLMISRSNSRTTLYFVEIHVCYHSVFSMKFELTPFGSLWVHSSYVCHFLTTVVVLNQGD